MSQACAYHGSVNGVDVVGKGLPRPGHSAAQGGQLLHLHDGANICTNDTHFICFSVTH